MKCVLGKSLRIKFNTIVHKSKGTLEYIHYDLCGPVQTTSLDGGTYLMSFINDFSRMVQVYVLKNKDKAFDKFKVWKTLIETKTEKEIKRLWTNNGFEFCNQRFDDYCTKSGIARHKRVRHTPHKMGMQRG